jgi:hypothetical protein
VPGRPETPLRQYYFSGACLVSPEQYGHRSPLG